MHSSNDDSQLAAAERRGGQRQDGKQRVALTVEVTEFSAQLENHSESGLFLTMIEPLQVTVVWTKDGEERTDRATLKRLASLPGRRTGWGLELVDDSNSPSHGDD